MIIKLLKKLFQRRQHKNWLDMALEMEETEIEESEMKRNEEEEKLKDEMQWTMVEGIDLTKDDLDDY